MKFINRISDDELYDFLKENNYSKKNGYTLQSIGIQRMCGWEAIIVRVIKNEKGKIHIVDRWFEDYSSDILQEEWIAFLKKKFGKEYTLQ